MKKMIRIVKILMIMLVFTFVFSGCTGRIEVRNTSEDTPITSVMIIHQNQISVTSEVVHTRRTPIRPGSRASWRVSAEQGDGRGYIVAVEALRDGVSGTAQTWMFPVSWGGRMVVVFDGNRLYLQ